MFAVIGQRDKRVANIDFCSIAGLPALKFICPCGQHPVQRCIPEPEIEKPIARQAVIDTDEFIDYSFTQVETEHKCHHLVCFLVSDGDNGGATVSDNIRKKLQ